MSGSAGGRGVVLRDSSRAPKTPQEGLVRIGIEVVLSCDLFGCTSLQDVLSTGHENFLQFQYFLFCSNSFIVI